MGQKGILLAFVEAMHLIDEKNGPAPARGARLSLHHSRLDILDPGKYGRQRDEIRFKRGGHEPGERGLAHAGEPDEANFGAVAFFEPFFGRDDGQHHCAPSPAEALRKVNLAALGLTVRAAMKG